MEQKYILLAHGLANMVLKNMDFLHSNEQGLLVSKWRPDSGKGTTISLQDLGMAMVALSNYQRRIHVDPQNRRLAARLLKRQAEFIASKLEGPDGSLPNGFDFARNAPIKGAPTLLSQAFGIRGLLEAYKQLEDKRFLEAASRAYAFMNRTLWVPSLGVYRSAEGATRTVYTPMNLGAVLGAMREMILTTKDPAELERYKRFWVQAVNSTGIQQSEYEETGERDFYQADADGDGIPRMEYAGGKYGIAPVYAAAVEVETPVGPKPPVLAMRN